MCINVSNHIYWYINPCNAPVRRLRPPNDVKADLVSVHSYLMAREEGHNPADDAIYNIQRHETVEKYITVIIVAKLYIAWYTKMYAIGSASSSSFTFHNSSTVQVTNYN